jgi:hypothetical protein
MHEHYLSEIELLEAKRSGPLDQAVLDLSKASQLSLFGSLAISNFEVFRSTVYRHILTHLTDWNSHHQVYAIYTTSLPQCDSQLFGDITQLRSLCWQPEGLQEGDCDLQVPNCIFPREAESRLVSKRVSAYMFLGKWRIVHPMYKTVVFVHTTHCRCSAGHQMKSVKGYW